MVSKNDATVSDIVRGKETRSTRVSSRYTRSTRSGGDDPCEDLYPLDVSPFEIQITLNDVQSKYDSFLPGVGFVGSRNWFAFTISVSGGVPEALGCLEPFPGAFDPVTSVRYKTYIMRTAGTGYDLGGFTTDDPATPGVEGGPAIWDVRKKTGECAMKYELPEAPGGLDYETIANNSNYHDYSMPGRNSGTFIIDAGDIPNWDSAGGGPGSCSGEGVYVPLYPCRPYWGGGSPPYRCVCDNWADDLTGCLVEFEIEVIVSYNSGYIAPQKAGPSMVDDPFLQNPGNACLEVTPKQYEAPKWYYWDDGLQYSKRDDCQNLKPRCISSYPGDPPVDGCMCRRGCQADASGLINFSDNIPNQNDCPNYLFPRNEFGFVGGYSTYFHEHSQSKATLRAFMNFNAEAARMGNPIPKEYRFGYCCKEFGCEDSVLASDCVNAGYEWYETSSECAIGCGGG